MPTRLQTQALSLLRAACFLISLWSGACFAADLTELEEIIDESRLTFARFVGHPSMTWFRERAANARAIFIAPQVTRASYVLGASWGTGVLLVRDPSTGRWSQPAFYRITGLSFGLQIGALHSEIVAIATDEAAAAEMRDGAFTLGAIGTLGAGRFGGGVSGSLEITSGSGFITVAAPTGLFAGVAVGGTLVLVRDGANELYYGRPVELDELRDNLVQQWYSERLIRSVAEFSAMQLEPQP